MVGVRDLEALILLVLLGGSNADGPSPLSLADSVEDGMTELTCFEACEERLEHVVGAGGVAGLQRQDDSLVDEPWRHLNAKVLVLAAGGANSFHADAPNMPPMMSAPTHPLRT
jgi:hypothetical protein